MSTKRPPDGEIRQSQVISTFGPGAMVDLPDHSVIIGGLEHWDFPRGERVRITEPRLEESVSELLGRAEIALIAPPAASDDAMSGLSGIKAFIFPTWFVAQVEEQWRDPETQRVYRTRPLLPYGQLTRGKYLNRDRKLVDVVPVRFVQACVRGHISDVNWVAFVYKSWQANRQGQLWLDEGGAGNDFSDIFVRCEVSKARRPLSDAKVPTGHPLGRCTGERPWLGVQHRERDCPEHSRLLVRSASNAYFPQSQSVISIPDTDAEISAAVAPIWEDHLQYCESEADVTRERRRQRVAVAIAGFTDAQVWAHIQARRAPPKQKSKNPKLPEIETMLSQPDSVGEDKPEGDFYARVRAPKSAPPWLADKLHRVVLVHRLREVVAQVGFTRFEPQEPELDGVLDINVKRGALAAETTWVPAVENRGEGVLITFKPKAIDDWLNPERRPGVKARGEELLAGLNARNRQRELPELPGWRYVLPYMMLHSLSHLLISAVSLECGYAASSIRERVYALPGLYGVLLYTGTPGAEGTLGGLVQVGDRIERHLQTALALGRLCSNDPVCSYHRPSDPHEERFSHGAACHGCLLIAETSCERRNEQLDRALVVPTVHTPDAAFFETAP
jgi:hypothetical protein